MGFQLHARHGDANKTCQRNSLCQAFLVGILSEVVRKSAYKGHRDDVKAFLSPVDCASLPGLMCCLASILQNRGLQNESVKAAWKLFEVLEQQCCFTGNLALLPDLVLDVESNMVCIDDWHGALEKLELQALIPLTAKQLSKDLFFWGCSFAPDFS